MAIQYFVNAAVDKVLETQLESSKREARQVAFLIGSQLENGISKDVTIINTQQSIENSNLDASFISVFDWSGKVVCHPDVKQIDRSVSTEETFVSSVQDNVTSEDFYDFIKQREDTKEASEVENDATSEVVYLHPVKNSDWIVGAHANTHKILQQINKLRSNFQNILLVMGFLFILLSVIIVRLIGSSYEKKLEIKNEKLSDEIINISKLNSAVGSYQQKVIDTPMQEEDDPENATKKRILTYLRHELLPVATKDIAYVYTENTITYVVCEDGKRSTTNISLDELFANLDDAYFFRANRQFIIAISAIDKIVRYGNNQLKILLHSEVEGDIIISKNKAAEFKKWLNL